MPTTLPQALERAASSPDRGITFHLADGERWFPLEELYSRAVGGAAVLKGLGGAPGDVVGILGPNSPQWATWAFSVWLMGGVVVPVQYPLRLKDPEAFAESTRRLVDAADCRIVMADESFHPSLRGVARAWDLPEPGSSAVEDRDAAGPDDPAVIQFTSGSTAMPRGVVLPHRSVMVEMSKYLGLSGDGSVHRQVSWLPFFHDWGLFGQLLRPIILGWESHIMPTESFARSPSSWLRIASRVGGTWLDGPPSAWSAAFRSALRDSSGIDLSAVRRAYLGAETISADLVDRMRVEGPRIGLAPEAVRSGYGMAEATLTLTLMEDDDLLRIDEIDLDRLVADGVAAPSSGPGTKRVVSCGAPVSGVEMRIVDPETKAVMPDRTVGEVWVRTASLMRGYLGEEIQPFEDEFLRTGDMGYMEGGQLYITGRLKDIIIVLGRNYAPEDFEWAAERVPGVKAGRAVAFAPPGAAEGAVVIAVEAQETVDPDDLSARIREAVSDAVGVTPRIVLVVAKGSIPKTTSGKLRRGAIREAFARGELARAHRGHDRRGTERRSGRDAVSA